MRFCHLFELPIEASATSPPFRVYHRLHAFAVEMGVEIVLLRVEIPRGRRLDSLERPLTRFVETFRRSWLHLGMV